MADVNNYPLPFSRTLNTFPTMANRKQRGKDEPHQLYTV